jgi:putative nucleotidyltransferase with HDIG domain
MSEPGNSHHSAGDVLGDVRRVKLWVQIGVYGSLGAYQFFAYFILEVPWWQIVMGAGVIAIVATWAIEYAFANFYKLRKHGMYPSMLAVELGATRDLRQACQRSTEILTEWLGAEAALLALLHRNERGVDILAAHGFPPGAIRFDDESAAHLQPFRDAVREQCMVSHALRDGHPLSAAFGSGCQIVYVPVVSMDRAVGVIALVGHKSASDLKDRALLTAIGRVMGLTLDNVRLYNHEYQTLLHILCSALDLRDRVTQGHSRRVADLSLAVASQLGVDGEELLDIERGAILHDIGKIALPDDILSKPGPLTVVEWEKMKRHPEVGYDMVRNVPFLRGAAQIVNCHHERYDGSGYPRGLKGEEIPLGARIFSVVDAYDAITSHRPYRAARSHEEALAEIQRHTGTQFDPKVVEAFLRAEALGVLTAGRAWPDTQQPDREAAVPAFHPAM